MLIHALPCGSHTNPGYYCKANDQPWPPSAIFARHVSRHGSVMARASSRLLAFDFSGPTISASARSPGRTLLPRPSSANVLVVPCVLLTSPGDALILATNVSPRSGSRLGCARTDLIAITQSRRAHPQTFHRASPRRLSCVVTPPQPAARRPPCDGGARADNVHLSNSADHRAEPHCNLSELRDLNLSARTSDASSTLATNSINRALIASACGPLRSSHRPVRCLIWAASCLFDLLLLVTTRDRPPLHSGPAQTRT
ncbi:hypothetical protein DENSPDRAFT_7097 [Dentipellis sp. KUC8613]|nr:hypothetical protein DENSPDRAFT_7097 [Dentipellis sp. KUC8613]